MTSARGRPEAGGGLRGVPGLEPRPARDSRCVDSCIQLKKGRLQASTCRLASEGSPSRPRPEQRAPAVKRNARHAAELLTATRGRVRSVCDGYREYVRHRAPTAYHRVPTCWYQIAYQRWYLARALSGRSGLALLVYPTKLARRAHRYAGRVCRYESRTDEDAGTSAACHPRPSQCPQ